MIGELNEHSLPDSIHKKAGYVQTMVRRMSRLLENLLEWARLQTGNLAIEKVEFSVKQAIDESIHLLQSAANIKDIAILYNGATEAEAVGDRRVIETIVRNLISNSIKFSEKGKEINVSLKNEEPSWEISVQDDGRGMESHVSDNLFNAENRPIKKGTQNEKGTGLGLLLCKDLIEKYGGSIDVESEPGKGTTISITFPKDIS